MSGVSRADEREGLRAERDEARKLVAEFEGWLDEALEALGAQTVFDDQGGR